MRDRPTTPTPLRQWLADNRGGATGRLLTQAARLTALTRELEAELPESLRGHWQLAKVSEDSLTLVAENPAWATQLRFCQSALLEGTRRALGFRPRTVQIRSNGYKPAKRARVLPKATMSTETVRLIDSCAATTEDARLRQSLQRLAKAGVGRNRP